MGNQGTAASEFIEAVEVIQSGAIGEVTEMRIPWTNRQFGRKHQASRLASSSWRMCQSALGPLSRPCSGAPYSSVYHPFKWRGWWDYGTGALGDMACHTANMAFMALDLGYPDSVSANTGPINPETYPAWATVDFKFPCPRCQAARQFYLV